MNDISCKYNNNLSYNQVNIISFRFFHSALRCLLSFDSHSMVIQ